MIILDYILIDLGDEGGGGFSDNQVVVFVIKFEEILSNFLHYEKL